MSAALERRANGATNNRFLKTLNVSDSPWACDGYNAGTIGHRAHRRQAWPPPADATNLHVDFLLEHGPQAVVALLEKHGLQPGAARFPIKLTDEADDAAFDASLNKFEIEAPLLAESGYTVLAYHLLPWSQATPSLPFHEHFRRTARASRAWCHPRAPRPHRRARADRRLRAAACASTPSCTRSRACAR